MFSNRRFAIFPSILATLAAMKFVPPSMYHTVGGGPKNYHKKLTSRYMPHQGEREMARRRRQMGLA